LEVPFQAPKQDESDVDDGETGLFAEINITPLTDVILVLLIIFMVSSSVMVDSIREGKLDVTLPAASTAAKDDIDADTVIVGITADGRIFMQGETVDEDRLITMLKSKKREKHDTMVVLQADGTLQHKRVIEVIDLLRESGFSNVGLGAETQ
jgi:biopolymer transport protein TolR